MEGIVATLVQLLDIQENMYNKAQTYREEHITTADTWDEFVQLLDEKTGFISAHWNGTPETEEKIKELTKATIRCIPLNNALKMASVYLPAPSHNGCCLQELIKVKDRL